MMRGPIAGVAEQALRIVRIPGPDCDRREPG
jgi:hypothetical protein